MPNYQGRAIFVGNLPEHVRERDLEDLFYKFGKILHVDLKRPARPPYFAFVEFADPRDAEEASRRRDGVEFLGARLRCEVAKGGDARANHRPVSARSTGYRVLIKGLPRSASWQDLKDHFRPYVKPIFTEVQRDRDGLVGVAEFETYDDMKLAIRKCDDTEFKNAFDKGTFIRVVADEGRGGRDDRDRDRGRDYDRGSGRDRERDRDDRDARRSRSPVRRSKSRSRSRSRSRSKSPVKSASEGSKSPERERSKSRSPSRERSEEGGKDKADKAKEGGEAEAKEETKEEAKDEE